jgi:hypothetical protein
MEPVNELALSGPDVTATDLAQGSILFVGTATVILRYAGFTILTDPNFLHRGDHVHLGHGMTAIRRTDPALELEALPPVDFVVLSHMKSRETPSNVVSRTTTEMLYLPPTREPASSEESSWRSPTASPTSRRRHSGR